MTRLERVSETPLLPKRPENAHKGMFGSVLVIAGSRGMAGAAALAGASALRAGAGKVKIASPLEVQPTVASFEPSYMTYPLPNDTLGLVDFENSRPILENLVAQADVIAVGPGLGVSDAIRRLVAYLIKQANRPLVIDADGLNALVGQLDLLAAAGSPVILTPHPGEFGRLTGKPAPQGSDDRVASAGELAHRFERLVVVLKGAGTVITDGRRYHVNRTGNPGMATAGSGDVLTGITAAFVAQHLEPFGAALLAAHIHGLAGDIARDDHGELGMIAGDIVDALPDALRHAVEDDELA